MSWRKCSICRTDIDFGQMYWLCSVSTCQHKRTGLFFCSVACWETHLPSARHREAWAEEHRAPSREAWDREVAAERAKEAQREQPASGEAHSEAMGEARLRRTISPTKNESGDELPHDVLIVVSKLKKYVKARSGMNTSDNVMAILSDELRRICDRAIRVANESGRKTVLDRDIRDALK